MTSQRELVLQVVRGFVREPVSGEVAPRVRTRVAARAANFEVRQIGALRRIAADAHDVVNVQAGARATAVRLAHVAGTPERGGAEALPFLRLVEGPNAEENRVALSPGIVFFHA